MKRNGGRKRRQNVTKQKQKWRTGLHKQSMYNITNKLPFVVR